MNLDLLRAFSVVVETGSLNRAAARLQVSQPTLTRQMQALEREIGGRLLERTSSGVAPTAAGHALREETKPLLEHFDIALGNARSLARGRSSTLRVGYLMSAAADCLNKTIGVLRRDKPEIKVKLFELSPGEQTAALRRGDIDIALLGYAGAFLSGEFYTRRLATLRVYVALGETHPLATHSSIRLRELRNEDFIGAHEADMPGHNQWIIKLCRRARFRPRFVENAESLSQSLSIVVSDGAIALVSEHVKKMSFPGVVFLPISDEKVGWEMYVAWQRGPTTEPLRAFLDSLPAAA